MDANTDDHQHDADHYHFRNLLQQWHERMFGDNPPALRLRPACKVGSRMVNIVDDDQPSAINPYIRLGCVDELRIALGDRAGSILWLSEIEHNSN